MISDADNVLADFWKSIRPQRRVFHCRPAFRFCALFLSRSRGLCVVARVARATAALARVHRADLRRDGGGVAGVCAVQLERRRRAVRQSLFHERVPVSCSSCCRPSAPRLRRWWRGSAARCSRRKPWSIRSMRPRTPNLVAARGFVRSFPVEVTMANDLPIALDPARAHLWFSDVLLSFLDKHAYIPETIDAERREGDLGGRRWPRRHPHAV